jgi:hypothetical protein
MAPATYVCPVQETDVPLGGPIVPEEGVAASPWRVARTVIRSDADRARMARSGSALRFPRSAHERAAARIGVGADM